MTKERLETLYDLEHQIEKLDKKVELLTDKGFSIRNVGYKTQYGTESIQIDPDENKLRETIHEIVTVYYEKRLAILKKRFEVL